MDTSDRVSDIFVMYLVNWCCKALVLQCFGTSVHWCCSALVLQCFIDAAVHWCGSALMLQCIGFGVHWCCSALVLQCIDASVHWCCSVLVMILIVQISLSVYISIKFQTYILAEILSDLKIKLKCWTQDRIWSILLQNSDHVLIKVKLWKWNLLTICFKIYKHVAA